MTEIGVSSIAGPRPQNEDGFLVIDLAPYSDRLAGLRALLVVADGMGGLANGELASRVAVEASQRHMEELAARVMGGEQLELEPFDILWDMVGAANAAVLKASRGQGGNGMGSTIVAAFVGEDRAWVAHVGDSRAYHLRPSGIQRVTTDHSRVERLVAEGVITEAQAIDHPQRNVVERALGFEGALPDFGKVWLQPADALVLASDGLFTALEPAAIMAAAASGETVAAAAARLTEAAAAAGTGDNTTVALWAADWPAFRSAYVGACGVSTAEPTLALSGAPVPTCAPATPAKQHRRAQYIYISAVIVALAATVALVLAATSGRASGGGSGTSATQTDSSAGEFVGLRTIVTDPDGANLRIGPDKNQQECGQLKGNVQLQAEPTDKTEDWYRVSTGALRQEDLAEGSVDQMRLDGLEHIYISSLVIRDLTAGKPDAK